MMLKYLMILGLFLSLTLSAQDYRSLRSLAENTYSQKLYHQSVRLYQNAFALDATHSRDLYNAACSASLSGNKNLAFEWLEKAIQLGYNNLHYLENDADLLHLHADSRWGELVSDLSKKIALIEEKYDKPLQKELLQIYESDQRDRAQYVDLIKKHDANSEQVQTLGKAISQSDKENLAKVIAILDKHGWVGPDKVGARASNAIFLVIQHAEDVQTRRTYLPMMREAVKDKRALASSLALLEDRVALEDGRKQIYGSQVVTDENGDYMLDSVEDPENVDERRFKMGLPPLADYLKQWGLTSHKKVR